MRHGTRDNELEQYKIPVRLDNFIQDLTDLNEAFRILQHVQSDIFCYKGQISAEVQKEIEKFFQGIDGHQEP